MNWDMASPQKRSAEKFRGSVSGGIGLSRSSLWTRPTWGWREDGPEFAVNLAGVYVNFILGSLAALAAWLGAAPPTAEILWLFAVLCYALAFVNLSPWLEHDGYYALMDLLDRPDLR